MRVPVVEFDGVEVDQVPLTKALRVVEDGLNSSGTSIETDDEPRDQGRFSSLASRWNGRTRIPEPACRKS